MQADDQTFTTTQGARKRPPPLDNRLVAAAYLCDHGGWADASNAEALRNLSGSLDVDVPQPWSALAQCNALASAAGSRWPEAISQARIQGGLFAGREQEPLFEAFLQGRAKRQRVASPLGPFSSAPTATTAAENARVLSPPASPAGRSPTLLGIDYEQFVPDDLQYEVMRTLTESNPAAALNLAQTSTTQAGLLERLATRPAWRGLLTPTTASHWPATNLLAQRLRLNQGLGIEAMPVYDDRLAVVTCLLEAFMRFALTHPLAAWRSNAPWQLPGTGIRGGRASALWTPADWLLRDLKLLTPQDRIKAIYEWIQNGVVGLDEVDARNAGLINALMRSYDARSLHAWDIESEALQLDDPIERATQPAAYLTAPFPVLLVPDEQLTSLGLDPLQETTLVTTANDNAEAASYGAPAHETANALRAYIDHAVASYMEGPCREVAMSGRVVMPHFTDLFDGPVSVSHDRVMTYVLLDARSPVVESLLDA
ncbi:hypothetical protein TW95_gp0792 [Pandoravirus inopinatum]|uniref:Uncharacterized protein n=1 Tax=Pandoravirus inopinatum TaxID=1605721 RepID=A0A0B5J9H4_9VIRU|nr:hypothetical protein TW95_gp0792 [Pandoravirus inopinatum]AJF97526.1 hypothetical protein [Pandoravirus inopinatum]